MIRRRQILSRGPAAMGAALMLVGMVVQPAAALTPEFRTCLARAKSEAANAACAKTEAAQHQDRLDQIWKQLDTLVAGKRDARHILLLRQAQRRWLAFRKRHCTFVAGLAPGKGAISVQSRVYWGQIYWDRRCHARLTQRRVLFLTLRLKAYAK